MSRRRALIPLFSLSFATLFLSTPALAQYTPWESEDYPLNLYWGDTHLHTSYSVDANAMGNVSLPPADAYRFARGEAVRATTGMVAKLNRPLDFLVVSDHAEQLGTMLKLREGDPRIINNPAAREVYEALKNSSTGDESAMAVMNDSMVGMSQGPDSRE